MVAAAGNDGMFDSTPDNPNFLMVSATDANDTLATFSSTGNNVDLAAPGVSILTTVMGGSYAWAGGTSLSAPIVGRQRELLRWTGVFTKRCARLLLEGVNRVRQSYPRAKPCQDVSQPRAGAASHRGRSPTTAYP